jgi:predicted nucleic acid-binding protein
VIVVVDTNVFVGACSGNGFASQVVAACLRGAHVPLMGTALFTEYEDVLARAAPFARGRLTRRERDELFDIFLAVCRWTRIYYGWRPNLPDEGDNHLVELAVAGGASHIITKNVDDVGTGELRFAGLAVVTPRDFLQEATR